MPYGFFISSHFYMTIAQHHFRYCIPMDDERPSLNVKHFHKVCPDQNGMSKLIQPSCVRIEMECSIVPIIAVFTKYDQFRLNIEMNLEDDGCFQSENEAPAEAERVFKEQYVGKLGVTTPFVCLESKGIEDRSAFLY